METKQYIWIESSYRANGVLYTTYGIAYADFSDGVPVILEVIPDLSTDKTRVQQLVKLCTKLQLSPMHLRDVIDDFLADGGKRSMTVTHGRTPFGIWAEIMKHSYENETEK